MSHGKVHRSTVEHDQCLGIHAYANSLAYGIFSANDLLSLFAVDVLWAWRGPTHFRYPGLPSNIHCNKGHHLQPWSSAGTHSPCKVAGMCLYHPALQCHWEACHLLTRTWTGRFGQFFFDITSQIPRWFSFCHGVRCRQIGRAAWPSREFGMPAIASHVPWFKKGTLQFGSS